ncbi:MAG: acylphosphatase [Coriobacteriia bacterium]|nr:acylphosphatase [Coriobacteriia bacterium]
MEDGRARARVLVDGVVQGVFFRAETRRAAAGLGVDGWVRNLPDGRVEAVFEGDPEAVRRAVRWAHAGPPRAVVERVEVAWEKPEGLLGFEVRH